MNLLKLLHYPSKEEILEKFGIQEIDPLQKVKVQVQAAVPVG